MSIRLSEADGAVIDRAASSRGRPRAGFVREAAPRAAEEVLMDHARVRVSAGGFAAFVVAVTAPAEPVPELVALFGRKAPWEAADGKPRR